MPIHIALQYCHSPDLGVCMISSRRCPLLCTRCCILPFLMISPCALRVSFTPAAFIRHVRRASMLHMAAEKYDFSSKTAPVTSVGTNFQQWRKSSFYVLPTAMGTAPPLAKFNFTATPRPPCQQGIISRTGNKVVSLQAHCSNCTHVLMFAI